MSRIDDELMRYKEILGVPTEKLGVNLTNLKKYIKYLKKAVTLPCELTGREDFRWEEYYVLGPGEPEEYEELKKTRASYTDKFQLKEILSHISDKQLGIMVSVKRGRRKFILPLEDLKVTSKKSINYRLIEEYVDWFVNY